MRVAPAATIFSTSSRVRTPPEALTPISGPTVSRMSCTSSTVAPPPAKPVDVLTKSAPAALASVLPITFSSRVSSDVSRMTLTSARPAAAWTTPRMSCSTSA